MPDGAPWCRSASGGAVADRADEELVPAQVSESRAAAADRCSGVTHFGQRFAGHGRRLGPAPRERPSPAPSAGEVVVGRDGHAIGVDRVHRRAGSRHGFGDIDHPAISAR